MKIFTLCHFDSNPISICNRCKLGVTFVRNLSRDDHFHVQDQSKYVSGIFVEPSLLTPISLQELKKDKMFNKMLAKRDKELEMLKRKQEWVL